MAYKTTISNITSQRRQQIKALQDEFTTFSWGGIDAFEAFGAFIINDKKGSLKFYNGPGFSNEYASPQFDNAGGYLQGISFKRQTIDFTIGVYWFSIEDYRKLLKWLDPLKVDYLQFGFSPNYRYDVKLAKRSDTTRWIVGRENGEPRYYTEMQLSFEIQGIPCAKGMNSYEFTGDKNSSSKKLNWTFNEQTDKTVSGECYLITSNKQFIPSDLETPIQVNFLLNLTSDNIEANYFYNNDSISILGEWINEEESLTIDSQNGFFNNSDDLKIKQIINSNPAKYEIKLNAVYNNEVINLCSMTLQHLAVFTEKSYSLNFTYYSETGLVFLKTGDSNIGNLLTLQTFTDSGEFLVESLQTTKFMLPGELDYPEFYNSELKFVLTFTKKIFEEVEGVLSWKTKAINHNNYEQPISIECYPRTNVI